MLDVITLLKNYLYAAWTETDPAETDIEWTMGYSEFDKIKAYPQINIDEITIVRSIKTYITKNIYRIDHEVLITIFMRPDNNTDTVIDAAETTFRKMKTEIDKILDAGRYSVTGVRVVEGEGWTNETDREARGRIVFRASQIVKCIYYEGS